MPVYTRDAQPEDLIFVVKNMRLADRAEAYATVGEEPALAVLGSYASSRKMWSIRTGTDDPVAIFGVAQHPGLLDIGVPWMVSTAALSREPRSFLRGCRDALQEMFYCGSYETLTNFVDERNSVSRKWLKWIGFREVERFPRFGFSKIPFWRFEMERKELKCV